MKNIMRLSSLLTMVALLALGSMMTACSDDDDNNSDWPSTFSQKAKINGTDFSIDNVAIVEREFKGVPYYGITAHNVSSGSNFHVVIPKVHMGKKVDLTKDLRPRTESPVTVAFEGIMAYGDGTFAEGSTMIASISGKTFKIYAKGQAKYSSELESGAKAFNAPSKDKVAETVTFDIQYSGSFDAVDPEDLDEK